MQDKASTFIDVVKFDQYLPNVVKVDEGFTFENKFSIVVQCLSNLTNVDICFD